ncbi:MAG TPA: AI-2E family transporter [Candidatus Sulfotelmatobacter sp.]|jgi:predicted PurR-regulated permease PerM|nr:AI-2E family transporter [Candidatus Sulfotelmatobacter sp.]
MELFDRRTASSLLTLLVFALVLAIAYIARTVIVVFAFSILFAYLIDPVVRFLQRHSLFFKNLRGPHVVEAYLAVIIFVVLVFRVLSPEFHKNTWRFLSDVPAAAERISSGEIANDLGNNLGLSDAQATRTRTFLQQHRSSVEVLVQNIERFASTAVAGILVVPILAVFFLSDGESLANQFIYLVSTKDSYEAMRSLAGELHLMLQHYIRAKVILAGLSLLYCSAAMLALSFSNALALGVLAGILEFIPVAGWMIAAATIVGAGAFAHSHWVWMLALLCIWRMLMDYWIAPRVMGHELEIHPLLAIFTVMVGGAVGGIVGIYLSVPLVAVLRVVWRNFIPRATGKAIVRSSSELAAVEGARALDLIHGRNEICAK